MFDHERLQVYRLALDFDAAAAEWLAKKGARVVRDQLERASLSVVLNIAEGAGRRAPAEKRHFYATARGSATECAAILDVLSIRNLITPAQTTQARAQLLSIVRMLSRLATPPELEPDPDPYPST